MAELQTEDEQVEALKRWWQEYRVSIITGVVLGLAALFGWRGWVSYQEQRSEEASTQYAQVLSVLERGGSDAASQAVGAIVESYDDTPYAALASLRLAQHWVAQDKPAKAREHLTWVVNNAGVSGLATVARLRMARTWLDEGKADRALAEMEAPKNPGFQPLYDELRGDVYQAQGNIAKARQAYQSALDGLSQDAGNRFLLRLKLNDLAGTKEQKT